MEHLVLLIVCLVLVIYCLLAKWLDRTILTAPMLAIAFGAVLGKTNLVPHGAGQEMLHLVSEVALIFLLFLDAAKIDFQKLRSKHIWPLRMLLLGMPISFLLGASLNWLLLPALPLAIVLLASALLIPTDAALGQSILENESIPERHRRTVTVESGLNDGIALPVILMLAALAAPHGTDPQGGWVLYGILQITLGPIAGIVVGLVGGWTFMAAKYSQTTSDLYEGIAVLALATMSYLVADIIGGNGFIAAFAAGIAFACIVKGRCKFIYEFTESEGSLLSWAAFFLIGALLVPEAIAALDARMFAVIALSLFVVRPLAIWIALAGTDADAKSKIFFGWFGPRGLATTLFALVVLEHLDAPDADYVLNLAVNAVWISALLHGVSSKFAGNFFAATPNRV